MDKIARIYQELDKRYQEYRAKMKTEDFTYYEGMADALDLFEQFLDTLSEEPDIPEFPETFEICLYDGRTPDNEKCTECSTTCSVRKEEPAKSLEEEIAEYFSGWKNDSEYGEAIIVETSLSVSVEDCKDIARHFAEWQASQMPMPEDTVLFNKGVAEGRRLEREDMLEDAVESEAEELYNDGESQCTVGVGTYFKPGDKVYVIKAEEE